MQDRGISLGRNRRCLAGIATSFEAENSASPLFREG